MTLDIGIGIFAALLVGKFFSVQLTPMLIGLGIIFALLPDIDFQYALFRYRGWRNTRAVIRHREILHYPLAYIPASIAIGFAAGWEWAILFALAVFGHFLHDSIGLGWGVAWLWPFNDKSYTFFYRYTAPGKKLPRRVIYRWNREDIDRLIDEYSDPHWLKNIYLKLHPIFATEVAGFLLAIYMLWRISTVLAGQ